MRKDENDSSCPSTLGEYRKMCLALGVPNNQAVQFLDKKIKSSKKGADEEVVAPDSQMRMLLMPLLLRG
jgi:hypothetical protein